MDEPTFAAELARTSAMTPEEREQAYREAQHTAAQESERARALRERLRVLGIYPRLVEHNTPRPREERAEEHGIPWERGWITVNGSRGTEVMLPASDVERLLDMVDDGHAGS